MLCDALDIEHKLIRPRKVRHNGKARHRHINEEQQFYSYLSFYFLDDLNVQILAYLKRSNNIS